MSASNGAIKHGFKLGFGMAFGLLAGSQCAGAVKRALDRNRVVIVKK